MLVFFLVYLNSKANFISTEILTLPFQTLEFWSYPSTLDFWSYFYTHQFSDLLLPNSGILPLFLSTLVFWCYPSKWWNSGPFSISIGIIILSFQTLEFLSYPSKQWNSSPVCLIVGILILSFQILVFWPNCFNHCNSELLPNTGILVLYLYTLVFSCYPSKRGNSSLISMSNRISILSFQTLEFWSYPFKPWNSCPNCINIRLLISC